jgi:hypothetical protein
LRRLRLSWPSLKIYRYIAFSLALQAGIAHGRRPALQLAIIFKPAIFHRLVESLAYVVENDPGLVIARNGKTDTIRTPISRHMTTAAGIAHIAEIAQFGFCGSGLYFSCMTGSGKSGT